MRERPEPLGGAFARLWAAATLSNLADGVVKVALPLLAIRYTDSPTLVAGLAFVLTLPWLLLALPAGVLADRLDRRLAMAGTDLLRAAAIGVVAVLTATGAGSIVTLYVVAFVLGAAETLHDTASQSVLPQLVPAAALSRANGRLYAAEVTANEFAGPPLGGLLVGAGASIALATPAGLWLAGIGVLLTVRGRFRVDRDDPAGPASMRAEIARGLRFLIGNPTLRTLAVMVGIGNFAGSAGSAVLVLYAVGPGSALGLSGAGYGLLLSTSAVGIVLGALVAGWVERRLGWFRSLGVGVVGSVGLVAAPAVTTSVVAVAAGFFVAGVCIAIWNVVTISLRQRITPPALLGRMVSVYRLLAWGTLPLGALTGGVVGEAFGLRAVFVVMTGVALLAVSGLLLLRTMPEGD